MTASVDTSPARQRRSPSRLEGDERQTIMVWFLLAAGAGVAAGLSLANAPFGEILALALGTVVAIAGGKLTCSWVEARVAYSHAAGAAEEAARAAKDARETYTAMLEEAA